jgi:hypothetical protein
MAFDKEEVKQLKELFDSFEVKMDQKFDNFEKKVDQKFDIFEVKVDQKFEEQNYNFKVTLNYELMTIKNDIEHIKKRLDQFFETESEDVKAAYDDIVDLQKRVKKMELKLVSLNK